jgi:hypothetical protein
VDAILADCPVTVLVTMRAEDASTSLVRAVTHSINGFVGRQLPSLTIASETGNGAA